MIIILTIAAFACLAFGLSPSIENPRPVQIDFKYAYESKLKERFVYNGAPQFTKKNIELGYKYTPLSILGDIISGVENGIEAITQINSENIYEPRICTQPELIRKANLFYIDKDGYPRYSNSNKLVHRCNMETALGRKLTIEEVVHHIDGDKRNFRIYNLRLYANQAEHDRFHRDNYMHKGHWHERIPEYKYRTRYA